MNEIFAPQILRGSFSAVWTATIARVGAFFSIFRDLQDYHPFAPFRSQFLAKIVILFRIFVEFSEKLAIFRNFSSNFGLILMFFSEIRRIFNII